MDTYTVVIKHIDGWWVGWIEEVPGVNCQERSRHELLDTLTITLAEALRFTSDKNSARINADSADLYG